MEHISKDYCMDFVKSLIPKSHTQALDFIEEHPQFDGRRVKIAIWDTGVDPAAEGLQVTSEGIPKLTYMCDTSGCGDIVMTTEVKLDEQSSYRKLKLLSDKEIQIPSRWNVKDNSVRLGVKLASDIFPGAVITRLSRDYKDNVWTKEMNRLLLELTEQKKSGPSQLTKLTEMEPTMLLECLDLMEKSYEFPVPMFDCAVFHDGEDYTAFVDTTILNPDLSIEDIPLLYSFDKKRQYSNFGGKTNLNFGVNVRQEGRVLELVTCSGSHGTHVASIAAGCFPGSLECNGIAPGAEVVSIKISDTRLGSMETGMALALAAQKTVELKCDIVNLSFGEASIQPNCGKVCKIMKDLVSKHGIVFCSSSGNSGPALSTVGSPGGTTDALFGISPMVFADMVESNYSLIPAPDSQQSSRSEDDDKRDSGRPQVYTWASRGPTTDGSWGIHVAAPGAAITSVAGWQNRNIGLMNGSSMSSPNACGAMALLISAAHQLGRSLSPWLISLATANTARTIDGVSRLSQGHGLLQIRDAFHYMQKYWSILDSASPTISGDTNRPKNESLTEQERTSMKRFLAAAADDLGADARETNNHHSKSELTLSSHHDSHTVAMTAVGADKHQSNGAVIMGATPLHKFRVRITLANGQRGLLLREPNQTSKMKQVAVSIFPDFDEKQLNPDEQANIRMYLHVVCRAKWVRCPRFFTLYNQERSLAIQVDPAQLPDDGAGDQDSEAGCAGSIHTTEIELHCLELASLGPLARLPVTVIRSHRPTIAATDYSAPSATAVQWRGTVCFSPYSKTVRQFLATPPGATALLLQVTPVRVEEGSSRFELRLMSVQPNRATVACELARTLSLERKLDVSVAEQIGYGLSCLTSCTVEVALAQYWSAVRGAELDCVVDFHGLACSSSDLRMMSSDNYLKILVESHLRTEEVSPSISINYLVTPVRPYREEISYVQQEILDYKEIINLDLYYCFTNPKAGDVGVFCPALGNLLYENDFLSQLYQIYDSNDRIVGTGDYKPEMYFFRLEKGEFRIKLQVRHTKLQQIEKLKDQPINIYYKTVPSLNFEFSRSLIDINCNKSLTGSKINFTLSRGEKSSLYITSNVLKVIKQFSVGSYLLGSFSIYKNEALKKAMMYPFQFVFTSSLTAQNPKADSAASQKLNAKLCVSITSFLSCPISPQQTQALTEKSSDSIKEPQPPATTPEVCLDNASEHKKATATIAEGAKLEFGDNLVKYLLSSVADMPDSRSRQSITAMIQALGCDLDPADLKLANLRASNKFTTSPEARWSNVDPIARDLIESWDTKFLADYCGTKFSDASTSLPKEEKLKMDRTKVNLIEVLCIYGISLAEQLLTLSDKSHTSHCRGPQEESSEEEEKNQQQDATRSSLDAVYGQLCRFLSPWDNNSGVAGYGLCLPFFVMHALAIQCPGRLLKLLLRAHDDQPHSAAVFRLIEKVMASLGWAVFSNHYRSLLLQKHPSPAVVACRP